MEGEGKKEKKKQYTVQKLQELPSISLQDLSEIRYFEHTQLENRDRRKVLLLVLRVRFQNMISFVEPFRRVETTESDHKSEL